MLTETCFFPQAIAPKYTSLAAAFPQAKFLRVDVDAQQAIAKKYKVSAMPTFLALKAGQVVETVRFNSFLSFRRQHGKLTFSLSFSRSSAARSRPSRSHQARQVSRRTQPSSSTSSSGSRSVQGRRKRELDFLLPPRVISLSLRRISLYLLLTFFLSDQSETLPIRILP